MSFHLGLTGSIGMGKSTTAQMFVAEGCALWDADQAVHRLYGPQGVAVAPIGDLFSDAIGPEGVDRTVLRSIIQTDPTALPQIEAIVHPLVQADRAAFKAQADADVLVFDIPLLFETGGEQEMDAVACVFTSEEEQQRRVLARGTMTQAQFEQIRAKQMPIDEKKARSDFLIETDTVEHAKEQVAAILRQIRAGQKHA
ncbi:dephospho-CoA kinase [Epibacterium sp. SM1969]|uniref:Dephospho-CoA kinase n=1 Tax=Tritonibacter aquimaris TaxID=2663379 RepID=A0A844ANH1_9RHOB|nr:dephospho-CoA kinase [Tritonibacter aquimaris]MQY41853.1 dephospho-CoA kinase [Tritonibacter aquimaris]